MNRRKFSLMSIGLVLIAIFMMAGSTRMVVALTPHQAVQNWAIIVAGTKGDDDPNREQEDLQTAAAYQCLLDRSYQADHIYFVSINASRPGVDNTTSKATVNYAVKTWLKDRSDSNDVVFMYFLDHGSSVSGIWRFNVGGATPNTTINQFEFATLVSTPSYGRLFFVMEACYSGALIEWLSTSNRTIITSTDADSPSGNYIESPYMPVFSYNFFSALSQMETVGDAFNFASEEVVDYFGQGTQIPLLDDNGDGVGHPGPLPNGGDGTIAFSAPWLPGDITANGIIDIYDVVVIAVAYGSTPSSPNWNPLADLNGDYIVNSVDLSMAGNNMGYPA